MESQHTIKNLKFNKNKSIGTVVIIVEGIEEEPKLIKHIFTKILDYNYIRLGKNNIITEKYQSKNNRNSNIIIANTKNSNIGSIRSDNEYKDILYKTIQKECNISLKNTSIYFIWDRDNSSNKDSNLIKKLLDTYYNARDNGYEMNELLLLSYPCLEVFHISNFKKQLFRKKFKTSQDAKNYKKQNKCNINKITDKTLLLAVENMNRILKQYNILEYDPSNFKKQNQYIFNQEEENFEINNNYDALSLISLILIDLGIITENKEI